MNADQEINTGLAWNTLDFFWPGQSRHDAVDPLQDTAAITPFGWDLRELSRGHGTTCASVAVSRGHPTDYVEGTFGGTEPDSYGPRVAGVAPAAPIVPIRCTNQVVILETVNPAFERALYYAIFDANVDVISCSLGFPPVIEPWLDPASPSVILLVNEARRRNIIFVAAAGQTDMRIIPMPASLSGAIAVTGCDQNGVHIGNTGPKVAIAAPALALYEAYFNFPDPAPAEPIREILGDPATSFATAQFAGIVALWLAYHGKQNLLNKYPNTPLSDVFSSLLPNSVNTPDDWKPATQGPGVIDAYKLLNHPLPGPPPPPPPLRQLKIRVEPPAVPLGTPVHVTVFAEDSITHDPPPAGAQVAVETFDKGGRSVEVQFPANALSPDTITFNMHHVHGPHGEPGDDLEPSGTVSAQGYANADIPFTFNDRQEPPVPPPPLKFEGEQLKILKKSSDFAAGPQYMAPFRSGKWSGDYQLWVRPPRQGEWVDMELPVAADGKYHLLVYLTKARDYGIVQFHLNGRPLGGPIDGFNPPAAFQAEVVNTGAIDLGAVALKKGAATLRVEVVGTNAKSVGTRYMWGLDYVVLKP